MTRYFEGAGLSSHLAAWLMMNLKPQGDPRGDVYGWRFDRQDLDRCHRMFTPEDLWPVARACEVPLRAIYGGRSNYMLPADAAQLEDLGIPVSCIPDAGHFLHVDAPAMLLDLLLGRDAG